MISNNYKITKTHSECQVEIYSWFQEKQENADEIRTEKCKFAESRGKLMKGLLFSLDEQNRGYKIFSRRHAL
jgi:hypothetical protein